MRKRDSTDAAWLRARLARLVGPPGDRLGRMREARNRYFAEHRAPERHLSGELTMLNTNIYFLVEQIVESGFIVFDRPHVEANLARNALTVAAWPCIAVCYRAMAEAAPAVCDFADDLDLMRRLVLDWAERCPGCFGAEAGGPTHPGIIVLDENGDEVPPPEVDLDEATLSRARAARLLAQLRGAAAANEAELRSLAAEGGSDELVAELRRAGERWVSPAEEILAERAVPAGERAALTASLESSAPSADAWPAIAERHAALARRSPELCAAFDRADLLRRLLLEILRQGGAPP